MRPPRPSAAGSPPSGRAAPGLRAVRGRAGTGAPGSRGRPWRRRLGAASAPGALPARGRARPAADRHRGRRRARRRPLGSRGAGLGRQLDGGTAGRRAGAPARRPRAWSLHRGGAGGPRSPPAVQRVNSFTAALVSQQLGGGDLAGLLRRFAASAAERDRVAADARSATAQARFTGLLVVAMPSRSGAVRRADRARLRRRPALQPGLGRDAGRGGGVPACRLRLDQASEPDRGRMSPALVAGCRPARRRGPLGAGREQGEELGRSMRGVAAALSGGRVRTLAGAALWLRIPQRLRRAGLAERVPMAAVLAGKARRGLGGRAARGGRPAGGAGPACDSGRPRLARGRVCGSGGAARAGGAPSPRAVRRRASRRARPAGGGNRGRARPGHSARRDLERAAGPSPPSWPSPWPRSSAGRRSARRSPPFASACPVPSSGPWRRRSSARGATAHRSPTSSTSRPRRFAADPPADRGARRARGAEDPARRGPRPRPLGPADDPGRPGRPLGRPARRRLAAPAGHEAATRLADRRSPRGFGRLAAGLETASTSRLRPVQGPCSSSVRRIVSHS